MDDKLYKYRTFSSRNLSMLANNKMYFSAPKYFNDPFDCNAVKDFEFPVEPMLFEKLAQFLVQRNKLEYEKSLEYLNHIKKNPTEIAIFLNEMRKDYLRITMQSVGVYTLSEKKDDILMWAHYADGHSGFCIEFNITENNIFREAEKVNYPDDHSYPDLNKSFWYSSESETFDATVEIMLTKSNHWKYEEERRLIERGEIDNNYKGHLRKYSNDMVNGVIFGMKMNIDNRNMIMKMLEGKDIQFYEEIRIDDKFLVEVIPAAQK